MPFRQLLLSLACLLFSAIAVAVEGRVVAVQGNAVVLEFPAGTPVQVGDRCTLAFDAPRVGRVPIQGTWTIRRIDAQRVHAEPDGLAGQARIGQVATLSAPAVPASGGLFPNPPSEGFDEYLARQQAAQPARAGGWLGIYAHELTPDLAQTLRLPAGMAGILVSDVKPGSPALAAGLLVGDVILDVDGKPITNQQLADRVRQSPPGTLLRLRVQREGNRLFLAVRLAAQP
jgi:membrane-associated protease RseP (regulator of RpoE activity)